MTLRALSFVRRYQDRLEFWIAKRLDSPNTHRGGHWSTRNRERVAWEQAIAGAVGPAWGPHWSLIVGDHRTKGGGLRPTYSQERRRVEVQIHVPSKRNFIRDDDNLSFSRKPLHDALKRLGLIYDDSRDALDAPLPTQHVSDDGRCWTVIVVSKPPAKEQAA